MCTIVAMFCFFCSVIKFPIIFKSLFSVYDIVPISSILNSKPKNATSKFVFKSIHLKMGKSCLLIRV